MRTRPLPVLLALALPLLAPGAAALVDAQVALAFDTGTSYVLHARTTFTDENATTYREGVDTAQGIGDGDGNVSPEEEDLTEAFLVRILQDENRSDHRLDGGLPAEVRVRGIGFLNLTGPVNRTDPVVLDVFLSYEYETDRTDRHTLLVRRDPNHAHQRFFVHGEAPPGWQVADVTGFSVTDVNHTFHYDEERDRGVVEGSPEASYGFDIVAPDPGGGGENATRGNGTGPALDENATRSGPQGQPSNDTGDGGDPNGTDPDPTGQDGGGGSGQAPGGGNGSGPRGTRDRAIPGPRLVALLAPLSAAALAVGRRGPPQG